MPLLCAFPFKKSENSLKAASNDTLFFSFANSSLVNLGLRPSFVLIACLNSSLVGMIPFKEHSVKISSTKPKKLFYGYINLTCS